MDETVTERRSAPSRIIPPVPPGWGAWEDLMAEALALARPATGATGATDEIPVGALVVAGDGRILGRGSNAPEAALDPTAHAEIVALRAASAAVRNYRLEGAVLVVTLEPCLMCAGALVHARLAGVVYGAADPRAGAVASCLEGLDLPFLNHRVWHMGGILAEPCAKALREFFATRR